MTAGLGRQVAAGAGALAALVVLVAGAAAGALGGILGAPGANVTPSGTALSAIPADYLALYQQAAATCPGLPWAVLAAIGTIESANGQSTLPGVHSGVNSAGVAEGPMQFEPATFARYDQPIPPGGVSPPSPYDPTDAVYAAARDLCANGAQNGVDLPGAVYAYNHDPAYVAEVLSLAGSYGQATPPASAVATVVAYAQAQIGTPYRWGTESPGVAFDCSGLVQAAYAAAGITLPRTAQAQYDDGPHLPAGTPLQPGDLLFFGAASSAVTHVGLYVGDALMIDAPHAGAIVQIASLWPDLIGATRPTA
jgi:cell wall-associated NlpC family hydrolase